MSKPDKHELDTLGLPAVIPRSDPERPQALDFAKLRLDQLWRQRQIGDATYLRSLFIAGYLPDEANTELNLLRMESA